MIIKLLLSECFVGHKCRRISGVRFSALNNIFYISLPPKNSEAVFRGREMTTRNKSVLAG